MSRRVQVLDHCRALPGSDVGHPFGEQTAVFTVGGTMFALVDLSGEHGRVTLKADPGHAAALVARYEQVTPGYYMNKRHWITVDLTDDLTDDLADDAPDGPPADLVLDLLEDSHALVVAGLPARRRPPPPDAGGRTSPAGPA